MPPRRRRSRGSHGGSADGRGQTSVPAADGGGKDSTEAAATVQQENLICANGLVSLAAEYEACGAFDRASSALSAASKLAAGTIVGATASLQLGELLYMRATDPADVVPLLERALDENLALGPVGVVATLRAATKLAEAMEAAGELKSARAALERGLAGCPSGSLPPGSNAIEHLKWILEAHARLAAVCIAEGDYAAADKALASGLARLDMDADTAAGADPAYAVAVFGLLRAQMALNCAENPAGMMDAIKAVDYVEAELAFSARESKECVDRKASRLLLQGISGVLRLLAHVRGDSLPDVIRQSKKQLHECVKSIEKGTTQIEMNEVDVLVRWIDRKQLHVAVYLASVSAMMAVGDLKNALIYSGAGLKVVDKQIALQATQPNSVEMQHGRLICIDMLLPLLEITSVLCVATTKLDEALDCLNRGMEILQAHPARYAACRGHWHALVALYAEATGDDTGAAHHMGLAAERCTRQEERLLATIGLSLRAAITNSISGVDRAEKMEMLAAEACQIALGSPVCDFITGLSLAVSGDPASAAAWWRDDHLKSMRKTSKRLYVLALGVAAACFRAEAAATVPDPAIEADSIALFERAAKDAGKMDDLRMIATIAGLHAADSTQHYIPSSSLAGLLSSEKHSIFTARVAAVLH